MSYGDGSQLKVSCDRLVRPEIKHATPGIQGEWFIHQTTVSPTALNNEKLSTCYFNTYCVGDQQRL